jgi:hypothetical protein
MTTAMKWGVIGGLVVIVAFVAWLFEGLYGVAWVFGIALVVFLLWFFFTQMLVQVEELEMGVVFGRRAETFKRFLVEPGWYVLSPFDHLRSTLSLGFQVASGSTKGARTAEGLPVTLEWWLSYQLKPLSLANEMRPGMSRALSQFAEGMVKNHGINCLQLVVGQCTVDDLCRPGIQQQLEQAFKEKVAERLKIFGIDVSRAMVHSIELPPQVLDTMKTAHEREVEATMLKRLYEVVKDFDDDCMTRLAELERMRLLGKHGVSLVYPMSAVMEGKQQRPSTQTGRSALSPVVRTGKPSEPKP